MAQKNKALEVFEKFKRSKSWFAKKLDVDRGTVYRWIERGEIPDWHHDAILRLAKRYEVEVSPSDLV